MTREHAVNHLSAVLGTMLAVYAVWAMLFNPTSGPLPGTAFPVAAGLLLLAVGASLLAWGASRIYDYG